MGGRGHSWNKGLSECLIECCPVFYFFSKRAFGPGFNPFFLAFFFSPIPDFVGRSGLVLRSILRISKIFGFQSFSRLQLNRTAGRPTGLITFLGGMGSVPRYILPWNLPSSFSGINSGSRYFCLVNISLQAGQYWGQNLSFVSGQCTQSERKSVRERETGVVVLCLSHFLLPPSPLLSAISLLPRTLCCGLSCMEALPVPWTTNGRRDLSILARMW